MIDIAGLLQQGAGNIWLFIPSAILLGALHGLEPGHSKTMMAAFIVAIRGTVSQAVLLGISATLSHTAVVWLVALAGMYFGSQWSAESSEPYFQVASGVLIIGVALWMAYRTWQQAREEVHGHHHDETKWINTGHGMLRVDIFEENVPPRFRLSTEHGMHRWPAAGVEIHTTRPDGTEQTFKFVDKGAFLESIDEIPEPHEFKAQVFLSHGGHFHIYDVQYEEHHHHDHGDDGLDVSDGTYQDAHEQAHANDIKRRFANRDISTGQIVMFGLTGGLIPCPAAITVLLLCLQLKKVSLGAGLVLCFSIGLALTMVASGIVAALSIRHVSKRWSGFGTFARKAPYFSSAVIIMVGLYVFYHGWIALPA
ncbi:nickel/cobalt efflux transporter [Herbaspirillum huttiense]|jgi:nickel/cobalt exporter|nr:MULTISPECIES: nickel/cobalt efflux transporter [Herbaspirillum]MCP3656839.1 nickel/cobalt efflux transporter RcnA [Herbaspirillum sp.]MCP3950557.1 nickel/cobalt efflux transporter RcnA [Herbaspirillum sp.]MCP4031092.1 nickel/cobalt efflux transporter RcnA [Herbaspirillum sp.]MRT30955.1 nickel/cobalt efflux transporter RcnA [Herbaspirillum sp. CAH-3]ONN67823.1 nickel/cobalt efflux protein RcnA [Herbaspirillum sp. VT-16-41]